jgi:hypothetical protein
MTRRFVGTGAVAYECGKLHNGQVPGVGIFNHGSDDTPATECPAGGTFRENPGGIPDGIGADGAKTVATEESQFTPPIASMRATMATIARNPSKQSGPWNLGGMRSFMMFWMLRRRSARKGDHPLQRSATPK